MAKGNIGNLLQHFVALRCAEALLTHWNQPKAPIAYVDCYSMAPWEEVTGKSSQGFDSIVRKFPAKAQAGDIVATAFQSAWKGHYFPAHPPAGPRDRDYPNTAVLLRTAFPDQSWEMRLHDIERRHELEEWVRTMPPGYGTVHGEWVRSPLICKAPVPQSQPVFVMLDPNQIVADNPNEPGNGFCLSESQLRYLVGELSLNLLDRPSRVSCSPAVITLFSYSDDGLGGSERIVTSRFAPAGWTIERVRSGPWKIHGRDRFHLGWVVSCHLKTPLVSPLLQSAWDDWVV